MVGLVSTIPCRILFFGPRQNQIKQLLLVGIFNQFLDYVRFAGTGGVSEENAGLGFRPAFCDADTDRIYASRFADGRLAPVEGPTSSGLRTLLPGERVTPPQCGCRQSPRYTCPGASFSGR